MKSAAAGYVRPLRHADETSPPVSRYAAWDLRPKLEIWVEDRTDPAVVSLAGDLTGDVARQLREVLVPLLDTGRHVVLDLGKVGFIDAGGVAVLSGTHHRARERGSGLVMINAGPSVRHMVEITLTRR